MQSMFANLPERKYKTVDLKPFDEEISEGISHEYNSSQTRNVMYQHDEVACVVRGGSRGHGQSNQAGSYGCSYTQGASGFGRGRGQSNQADNYGYSYTQGMSGFGRGRGQSSQAGSYGYSYTQGMSGFGRGRGQSSQADSYGYSYTQGMSSFGRECKEFSNNSNVFASTEPVIKNEYDGHASLNTGDPDRGFGALSTNVNTQGWYAQPDESQSHQPFVSRQSTLEQQNGNQDTPAISGFNKSRLSFDNNKRQRDFAQLSEGSLQVQSKNQAQNRSQVQNRSQAQNITAEGREARFGTTSQNEIYAQLKKNHVVEREQAIKDGFTPNSNAPRRSENAIDFRSTCETKCPEFEMIKRETQNNVDRMEMDENGSFDRNKAAKTYKRSAAGNDQPLSADVRSSEALMSTLDYLIQEVMSTCPLEKCHAFIRDRTRSIIQHFTLQSIRDVTAVKVYERIARFHILCLHEMCGLDESKFSEQQEIEQLRKVLLSLMEFYDDLRGQGIETPNEAEFRAYYIITHIRDKDVARQISSQPAHIFKHPHVKQALKFHAMAQRNDENEETSSRCNKEEKAFGSQNNYASFFKLIADPHTSFLMACLLETHFPEVRKGALKSMSVDYMARTAGVEAEYVRKVLCYDSLGQCLKEAKHYGIRMDISSKEPTLLFGLKHYESRARVFLDPMSYPAQRKSVFLVDAKKDGKTFSEIVNGCKAIDKQSAPITHAAVYAQHKAPINESKAQRYYYSGWLIVDSKSTCQKRARTEDRCMVKEQKMLEDQRRSECRRRIGEQRRLEEQQRLEEIRAQAIKRKNERKQRRDERRRRLNKRMQKLEEKQKMMERRRQIMEERIRRLQKAKKRLEPRNVVKKKAGAWLRRVQDKIVKRSRENPIHKNKRKLKWILMKTNTYCKFDYLRSNKSNFNGAEIDKRIQQSLDEDYIMMDVN
ncbi:hypothetical protein G6F55_010335 [Rhizopus delemar]|uniref:SAC3/GANP/THP3 conserved domain-containing protein n=2 Tax=Rhizopus TaxID=4842 RepID=A0A9P7CJ67_9FUNG|nr:hypothetical protein G6F55_010335 [Rhizopus delemar]KAG1536269.1 hypothetical protein G6F51_011063 [Rhizopus arrhizus]KAG1564598.1 hypothetical protein G6F50_010870 [Rhizopus delemar]